MSLLPGLTYSAPGVPLYGGGGGGGGGGSFSTINVSTIDIQANGDVNYIGSINFNQGSGGGASFLSTVSVLDGTTPATELLLAAPNNLGEFLIGIGNDNKAFISSSGTGLTWNGGNVSGLANVTTSTIAVSTINGSAYPPVSPVSTLGLSAANFPGGNGVVPINSVPFALTDSFAVDVANNYRVSYTGSFSNVDGSGPTFTSAFISGTSPNVYINTLDNRTAVSLLNLANGTYSATFKPSGTPCQLVFVNSSAVAGTAVAINTGTGVVLQDLGPA